MAKRLGRGNKGSFYKSPLDPKNRLHFGKNKTDSSGKNPNESVFVIINTLTNIIVVFGK